MQMLRNHKNLVQTYSMVPQQQALLQPGLIIDCAGIWIHIILFLVCCFCLASYIDLTADI